MKVRYAISATTISNFLDLLLLPIVPLILNLLTLACQAGFRLKTIFSIDSAVPKKLLLIMYTLNNFTLGYGLFLLPSLTVRLIVGKGRKLLILRVTFDHF